MKLNLKRKPKTVAKTTSAPVAETTDAKKRLQLHKRLKALSETVRRDEISAEPTPLPRTPVPMASPPSGLSVTVTKTVTKGKEDDPSTETVEEKKLWASRSLYGRHLPVLQCNSCSISRVCPKYKAGYECAYLPYLNNHKVRNELDLVKYMKILVGNQMRRTQLMSIIEAANGGMPSLETSEAMDSAFNQLKELHKIIGSTEKSEMSITGDATIVGSIFGGIKLTRLHEDTKQMSKMDLVPMEVSSPGVPSQVPQVLLPSALPQADPLLGFDDVSRELVKDVMLSKGDSKKSLQTPRNATVEIGNLSKG